MKSCFQVEELELLPGRDKGLITGVRLKLEIKTFIIMYIEVSEVPTSAMANKFLVKPTSRV